MRWLSNFISNKFCKSNQKPFNEKLMGKLNEDLYNTEERGKLRSIALDCTFHNEKTEVCLSQNFCTSAKFRNDHKYEKCNFWGFFQIATIKQ